MSEQVGHFLVTGPPIGLPPAPRPENDQLLELVKQRVGEARNPYSLIIYQQGFVGPAVERGDRDDVHEYPTRQHQRRGRALQEQVLDAARAGIYRPVVGRIEKQHAGHAVGGSPGHGLEGRF